MDRFLISEMDACAEILAREHDLGLEVIDFCRVENLTDEAFIEHTFRRIQGLRSCTLHAPYCEIFPSAIDPMVLETGLFRLRQAAQVCAKLGIKRMIVHSGYAPMHYYPEWFVPKSIAFWQAFMKMMPENLEIVIENVLDPSPLHLAQVCDGIGDSRVGICLDVGHANAYSEIGVADWIEALNGRIRHVHLHDNHGCRDEHASLGMGNIDFDTLLNRLAVCAPNADWCIESVDAAACINELKKRSWLP